MSAWNVSRRVVGQHGVRVMPLLVLLVTCTGCGGSLGHLGFGKGCSNALPTQPCDKSTTAAHDVYVQVINAGNGNHLVGARVEIVDGSNTGAACVTAEGGLTHYSWFGSDDPGCYLAKLHPWNRRLRVTKDGFRPVEIDATGPSEEALWTVKLTRKKR